MRFRILRRVKGLWLKGLLWLCWIPVWAQPLLVVEGVVELRATADAPWRPAAVGEVLEHGGQLRTLQGEATLALLGGILRLAPETAIERQGRHYLLLSGRSYAQAEEISFVMGGVVRVSGEARFDALAGARRVAVLDGSGRITWLGRVLEVASGEQLIIAATGELSLSRYYERDPWYRNLIAVGEGRGQVLGFAGVAELRRADGDWQLAAPGMAVGVGDAARTGEAAWLELRFDDGNLIRLQADSEIAIVQLSDFDDGSRRTVIDLRRGRLWAVVEGDEPFEIETPGLVAGVRGTTLRVDAAMDRLPPRLKTFEGTVAAIVGLEVVDVAAGEQFDVQQGVAPLVLDDIDRFNLERDRLLTPPLLSLAPPPARVAEAQLELRGVSEPGVTLVASSAAGGVAQQLEVADFAVTLALAPGFNLVRLSAEREGSRAQLAFPVIREGVGVQLAVAKPTPLAGGYRLRGVTASGTTVRVQVGGVMRQVVASARGHFSIAIPGDAEVAEVTVWLAADDRRPAARALVPLR